MLTDIASLATLVVALAAALFALFRWIGRVDANTDATKELTVAFKTFTTTVTDKLTDHEVRLSVLERTRKPDRKE